MATKIDVKVGARPSFTPRVQGSQMEAWKAAAGFSEPVAEILIGDEEGVVMSAWRDVQPYGGFTFGESIDSRVRKIRAELEGYEIGDLNITDDKIRRFLFEVAQAERCQGCAARGDEVCNRCES